MKVDNVFCKGYYLRRAGFFYYYCLVKYIVFLCALCLLSGCGQGEKPKIMSEGGRQFIPKYSKRFKIDYYENGKLVSVLNPSNGQVLANYFLADSGHKGKTFPDAVFVQNPAGKIICLSTTHISALSLAGAEANIQAIANHYLIYNEKIRQKVAEKAIEDVGFDYNPDIEKIVRLRPDLVFSDAETPATANSVAKLPQAGIPIVISNDYKEESPLARAEWIYFFAAFVNREATADSLFRTVEKSYLGLKNGQPEKRLTVFCNQPYQGIWYMPSRESYTTQLISDAGGAFLWKDEKSTNGFNLSLNFEQVFRRAQYADVWLLFSHEKTRTELVAQDPKLQYFEAFRNRKVYVASKRSIGKAGSDYWESGCFLPHIVLNDLRIILHNLSEAEDSLFYFHRLE